MQAANLLAVIAPVNQGKGAPGGPFAAAEGDDAQTQGADAAANPFAQALAALMAAPGQAQAQTQATPGDKGEDAETAPAAGDFRNRGLETALAAVTANGAVAKGLIRQTTPSIAPTTGTPTETPTGDTAVGEPPVVDTDPAATAPPTTAPADTAQTEELAAAPAMPAPVETAPEAAPTASPATLAADTPPPSAADPVVAPASPVIPPLAESAPPPAPETEAPPALPPVVEAEPGQTPPPVQVAEAATPRAEGKALGKTEPKGGKSALAPGQTVTGHARGQATAPGQVKKAAAEAPAADTPAGDSEVEPAAIETAQSNTDAPGALVAGEAHAMSTLVHGDGNRLAAHTVAHLASQIVSKSEGKATRFDVQLDPAGLGKVDVRIEISRGGEISAALSFDNPQAAAEMRSRAGELRQALEQAGFDLSKGGLSFDLNSQNPGHQPFDQQAEPPRPSWARGAFTDLAALPEAAPPALRRMIAAGGVDVTI